MPSLNMRELLLKKYKLDDVALSTDGAAPRHAMFFELTNGTGWHGGKNYLDAFLIDLWPSGSFARRTFEIKVSRSDFLSEIANPNKRKWGMEISNEFWFVCAHGICEKSEIPENCGLLVATKNGDKLRVVKPAQYRESRDFKMTEVMALARQSCNYKINSDPKWLYEGSELDDAAFESIVASRVDASVQSEISQKVDEKVAASVADTKKALETYAEAMKKQGVNPPAWMSSNGFYSSLRHVSEWQAENWVRQNIKQPPSVENAAKALKIITDMEKRLLESKQQLESLLQHHEPKPVE